MFSVGGRLKYEQHESPHYQQRMAEGNSWGIFGVCTSLRDLCCWKWMNEVAMPQGTGGAVLGWDHGLRPSPPKALPRALVSLQLWKTDFLSKMWPKKIVLKTSGWGHGNAPLRGEVKSLWGWMAPNSSPLKSSELWLFALLVFLVLKCGFCSLRARLRGFLFNCWGVTFLFSCWGGTFLFNCWGGLCWWPGPGRAQTGNVRYNSNGCAEVQPGYFSAGICGFVRNSYSAARQQSGRGHSKK